MSEAGQVQIGHEFFDKVKLDYADWRWALVREFAQNCIDAPGCKRVEFEIVKDGDAIVLTVSNDGASMDRDTLVGKLLTLGGSGKNFDGENTGGFGVAKSLLYYTHRSYVIQTGVIEVTGNGAQYTLTSIPFFSGTRSRVVLEGEEDGEDKLEQAVRRFASLCQWRGTFLLNGEVLATDLRKGMRRRDLGWGIVYTNRSSHNLCVVRLNGQPMFTRWTRCKGVVLIELTGKAKDCLTSNRDALKETQAHGKLDSELSDLLTALAVDKKSALREQRAEYKRYAGERQRNEARKPKVADVGVAALIDSKHLERILGAVDGGMAGIPNESVVDAGGVKVVVTSREDEPDRTISLGPEFIVKNTTGLKVPTWFTPGEKFSKLNRELVRAWVGILLQLHKLCDVSGEFSVGFVFDEESEAECERGTYGLVYYLNPVKVEGKRMEGRFKSTWTDRHELISTACHEFVHGAFGLRGHDEDYAGKLTEVMTVAMKELSSLERHCQSVPGWLKEVRR